MHDTHLTLPLTVAQHAIWIGHQMDALSAAYNVAGYIDIHALIDSDLLERAAYKAVSEVDCLRARFSEQSSSEEVLITQQLTEELYWRFTELDFTSNANGIEAAKAWMDQDASERIDLVNGPIVYIALIKVTQHRLFIYLKTHHIALDGFALFMVWRRIAQVYAALTNGQSSTHTPFGRLAQVVESERIYRCSEAFTNDSQFWRTHCEDIDDVPSLVTSVAMPANMALRKTRVLASPLVEKLQELSSSMSTHWLNTLIAAFAAFISRATSRRYLVLGVPFLNRLGDTTATVPCTSANVLPLRLVMMPSDTVRSIVERVGIELAAMRQHQRYRAEDVRRDCKLVGEDRRLTGPQINIAVYSDPLQFGTSQGHPRVVSAGPADDISFIIQPGEEQGTLLLLGMANPLLYDQDNLNCWVERFAVFIERFVASLDRPLGQLDAFDEDDLCFVGTERDRGPAKFEPPKHVPGETLVEAFEQQARTRPDAPALTYGNETLSYSALDSRANRLARAMASTAKLRNNARVALLLPRSIDTVTAILAALKLGAAYVPIDTEAPAERIHSIIDDTQALIVLTTTDHAQKIGYTRAAVIVIDDPHTRGSIEAQSSDSPIGSIVTGPNAHDLAYIIFTSGSTGRPKGVKITHNNVVRLFEATDEWFEYKADDVWTMCHAYVFDASVWEMWGALSHGGRLVIVPVEVTRAPDELLALVVREGVTVFGQIPSAFYRFMEAQADAPELAAKLKLRYQCFGGEGLDLRRLKPWFERYRGTETRLLNMYGITETTINATYRFIDEEDVDADRGSLIGTVYSDLRILLLDDALRPVPKGSYGEIYVTGAGLADGYLNRPDLDAVRFVANPYGEPGTRMYRSGDVARLQNDGILEYIGRADQQVKIRGYRIELGEVEARLRECKSVSDAVVSVRHDTVGDAQLIAHVVPRHEDRNSMDVDTLREYLRGCLPAYMVPSAIGVLDTLPMTRNGKVDRKALPDIAIQTKRRIEPARDELDLEIISLWQSHCSIEDLSIDDNFFDIGGDSIKAIRVARALGEPVKTMFTYPTARALADHLRSARTMADSNDPQAGAQSDPALHYFRKSEATRLTLVCVPFAGGNVHSYRELAQRLPNEFQCVAVNLPGHDPAAPDENFEDIDAVVARATDAIRINVVGPIIVYGHCAGNAIALALARNLIAAGARVAGLVIGGMLIDADPHGVLGAVNERSGNEIIEFLRQIGGFKDVLDGETLAAISRMTKHDAMQAATFFAAEALNREALRVPIQVVVGDADPLTSEFRERWQEWHAYSDTVELSVIAGGGHYFVVDNAAKVADILHTRWLLPLVESEKNKRFALRPFENPFDDEDMLHVVLENPAGARSLWPTFAEHPPGWRVVLGPASRLSCLGFLNDVASQVSPSHADNDVAVVQNA